MTPHNVHATAVVLGTRGFLFVGPSGSGKSAMALSCLSAARQRGLYSALVGDDQIFLSIVDGKVIARAPASIRGLVEIRGSGIVTTESIPAALMDYAVRPLQAPFGERLPPTPEYYGVNGTDALPLVRVAVGNGMDPLTILLCLVP